MVRGDYVNVSATFDDAALDNALSGTGIREYKGWSRRGDGTMIPDVRYTPNPGMTRRRTAGGKG